MSNRPSLAIAAAILFALAPAFAATPTTKPLTPQQQRMSACSKQTAGKKGDERKAAMSACLKGTPAPAAAATPQERMKSCNADAKAKALSGDARKAFMSTCLKKTAG
ncbi:MAG TPA: PsiF family protein [Frateuria sp.]|uniref:PsiF family protein n=1 Tax=Frateuria sp. TaxID=2211372 RepID=UPI002DE5E01C|nr:PsiF family protein [Frateuria sp.]